MLFILRAVALGSIATLFASHAFAVVKERSSTKSVTATPSQPTVQPKFTNEQVEVIEGVESYLSQLSTIIADFVQIAPDGALTSGKFYLSRPGKMRWQYDPPTPILMISNGTFLTFYDYELDQISNIPLNDTLAGFLAREHVVFGNDVTVTDITKGPGSLRITMIMSAKPKDGTLTLEFATGPLLLRNMVVTDAVGQTTTVALNNARYGVELDNSLFIFDNPRLKPRIGKNQKRK